MLYSGLDISMPYAPTILHPHQYMMSMHPNHSTMYALPAINSPSLMQQQQVTTSSSMLSTTQGLNPQQLHYYQQEAMYAYYQQQQTMHEQSLHEDSHQHYQPLQLHQDNDHNESTQSENGE